MNLQQQAAEYLAQDKYYEAIALYEQYITPAIGDWAGVFVRVGEALKELINRFK